MDAYLEQNIERSFGDLLQKSSLITSRCRRICRLNRNAGPGALPCLSSILLISVRSRWSARPFGSSCSCTIPSVGTDRNRIVFRTGNPVGATQQYHRRHVARSEIDLEEEESSCSPCSGSDRMALVVVKSQVNQNSLSFWRQKKESPDRKHILTDSEH